MCFLIWLKQNETIQGAYHYVCKRSDLPYVLTDMVAAEWFTQCAYQYSYSRVIYPMCLLIWLQPCFLPNVLTDMVAVVWFTHCAYQNSCSRMKQSNVITNMVAAEWCTHCACWCGCNRVFYPMCFLLLSGCILYTYSVHTLLWLQRSAQSTHCYSCLSLTNSKCSLCY